MKVFWVGWFRDSTSDKLWGILKVGDAYYNFWCRRGAKMQFKRTKDIKYGHKIKKGYVEITTTTLEDIYPRFFNEAQSNLVFALMADNV